MKIWEAILYGIFGGATELLPISFTGHYALLREVFDLTSLTTGGGYYIRLAISLSVIAAIVVSFRGEATRLGREVLCLTGLKRRRRNEVVDRLYVRSVVIFSVALALMLLSLIFTAFAGRTNHLLLVAGFFTLNGLLIFGTSRGRFREKDEGNVLVSDAFFLGLGRMLSVFPGLSSLSTSLFVGKLRGIHADYNFRLAYMLTLAFQVLSLIYHLIRAIVYGSFTPGLLLPFAIVLVTGTAAGYLAIQYFRYLVQRKNMAFFAYYCWDAAAIALVISLINA